MRAVINELFASGIFHADLHELLESWIVAVVVVPQFVEVRIEVGLCTLGHHYQYIITQLHHTISIQTHRSIHQSNFINQWWPPFPFFSFAAVFSYKLLQ